MNCLIITVSCYSLLSPTLLVEICLISPAVTLVSDSISQINQQVIIGYQLISHPSSQL